MGERSNCEVKGQLYLARCDIFIHNFILNPNQAGLFWLFCGRGGGGGWFNPPPQISAVDYAIAMKIGTHVTCGVIYQTVKKNEIIIYLFLLINYANLCIKSYFLL